MKILDIGCGNQKIKREGAIVVGLDNDPNFKADVTHDLEVFPYPFKDNEFDDIVCSDVLEHLHDVPMVIKEMHRIGKKGAIIHIKTPHFSSLCAYINPTHVRPFSVFSFDFFCENPRVVGAYIQKSLFRLKNAYISFPRFTRTFLFPFVYLANRFPLRYEEHFAFLLQAENIHLELEIIK